MPLLANATATIIAAASAAGTVGTLFAYLYFARRSEAHAARDEALALAETRGEMIAELRERLAAVEHRLAEEAVECANHVRDLERALQKSEADAREHAYWMQRFYAASLGDLLRDVQANLEETPPNLERALVRIREVLDGERPAA